MQTAHHTVQSRLQMTLCHSRDPPTVLERGPSDSSSSRPCRRSSPGRFSNSSPMRRLTSRWSDGVTVMYPDPESTWRSFGAGARCGCRVSRRRVRLDVSGLKHGQRALPVNGTPALVGASVTTTRKLPWPRRPHHDRGPEAFPNLCELEARIGRPGFDLSATVAGRSRSSCRSPFPGRCSGAQSSGTGIHRSRSKNERLFEQYGQPIGSRSCVTGVPPVLLPIRRGISSSDRAPFFSPNADQARLTGSKLKVAKRPPAHDEVCGLWSLKRKSRPVRVRGIRGTASALPEVHLVDVGH